MKLNIEKNTLVSATQEPDDREVIVPDGVKCIGKAGLAHLPLIEKIVLPDSVRTIEAYALVGDVSLRELTMPITASLNDKLYIVYEEDIKDVAPLEKLTLTMPKGKENVTISPSFTKRLRALPPPRHVVFGSGMDEIPQALSSDFFKKTQILEFGKDVKKVSGFSNMTELTHVIFPGGLYSIESLAFQNCVNLHEVRVPEKCQVDQQAFEGCGTMRDGKQLAAPEFSIIRYQPTMEELEPGGLVETLTLPGIHMTVCNNKLFSTTAENSVREIVVPEGIRVIEAEALAHLPYVERIILPDSVEKIESYAFEGDKSLAELTFPVTAIVADYAVDGNIFAPRGSKINSYYYCLQCVTLTVPKGKRIKKVNIRMGRGTINIKRLVFRPGIEAINGELDFCHSVQRLEFPEGLRKIGDWSFNIMSVQQIIFPSTLESIGSRSFNWLHLLHEVHLPKNCEVGNHSFEDCGEYENHEKRLPAPRFEIIRD